jgi:hypothetical protein
LIGTGVCDLTLTFLRGFAVDGHADDFTFFSVEADVFAGFDAHIKASPNVLKVKRGIAKQKE